MFGVKVVHSKNIASTDIHVQNTFNDYKSRNLHLRGNVLKFLTLNLGDQVLCPCMQEVDQL